MNDLILYVEGARPLDPERGQIWLSLGHAKQHLDDILLNNSLALQQILVGPKDGDIVIPTLAERITQYKSTFAQMKAIRLDFTSRFIDGIKDNIMTLEKKYDPEKNADFLALQKAELDERIAAKAKQDAVKNKQLEELAFSTHVQNEYTRTAGIFKQTLNNIIFDAYQACLKVRASADDAAATMELARRAIRETQPMAFAGFPFKLLNHDDIQRIVQAIPAPQWSSFIMDAENELANQFAFYENDKDLAPEVLQQHHEEKQQAIAEEVQQQVATSTLIASAGVYVGEEVKIKEATIIAIPAQNDPKWVVAIMAAFMANFTVCMTKVKVKKYDLLNIGQMAAALDAAKIHVKGVEYASITK